MTGEQRTLRRLIDDGMYVVDADAVTAAIMARARVRAVVAGICFQSELEPAGQALPSTVTAVSRPALHRVRH